MSNTPHAALVAQWNVARAVRLDRPVVEAEAAMMLAVGDRLVAALGEAEAERGQLMLAEHKAQIERVAALGRRDAAVAEAARLRAAMQNVMAHTGLPQFPSAELLRGLIESVARIARAALTPEPPRA